MRQGVDDERQTGPTHPARYTIIVASLATAIAAVVIYLGIDYERHRVRPAEGQEVTMPDGTVLVLEQVTFGRQHSYRPKEARQFSLLSNQPRYGGSATTATAEDTIIFWFSRHGEYGQPLDFEWWLRCVAVGGNGSEWFDDSPMRAIFQSNGSIGIESATRPVAAKNQSDVRHIVACSSIRPFRHPGSTFRLRVIGVNNVPVAEFDVPDPAPAAGQYPTWQAEALPETKSDGDLTMTLQRITAARFERAGNSNSPSDYVQLNPVWTVTRNGQPATDWSRSNFDVVDATGRSGSRWDCPLSPTESAWKVKIGIYRGTNAEFEPDERWAVPDIAVAAKDKSVPLSQSTKKQGFDLELIAMGGPGEVSHFGLMPGNQGGWHSSGAFQLGTELASYQVSTVPQNSNMTTVTCARPHIVARVSGIDSDHPPPDLLIVDDQKRAVPVLQLTSHYTNIYFWFIDPPNDAKTLDLTFLVQKARKFEFLIKPPRIEPTAKFAHADELARHQQWADAAAEYSRALDEYAENHWHWYHSVCLQAQIEDRAAYRAQCTRMLELFHDTDDPAVAERTAKACLIWQNAAIGDERLYALAERAVAKDPTNAWYVLVKGIAECRAERFQSAVEWLTKAEQLQNNSQFSLDLVRLFRAIALQKLGQLDGARQAFTVAADDLDRFDSTAEIPILGSDWHDRLMCRIVRREVEQLLKSEN